MQTKTMATSTVAKPNSSGTENVLLRDTEDLLRGQIGVDEFFCVALSLLGLEQTYRSFFSLIKPIQHRNTCLYKELSDFYTTYFAQQEVLSQFQTTLEPKCEIDEDLDYELAIKMSLDECGLGGSDLCEPDSLDAMQSHYLWTENVSHTNNVSQSWASVVNRTSQSEYEKNGCNIQDAYQTHNFNDGHTSVNPEMSNTVNASHASHPQHNNGTQLGQKSKKSRKGKHGKRVERPLMSKPVIYWFRRDLRIYDNVALLEVAHGSSPIIPVFVWSEVEEGPLAAGGATKVWLHYALDAFNKLLKDRFGTHIVFRKTNSCHTEIRSLVRETGAGSVVWNDLYEPCLQKRDDAIEASLSKQGVEVKRYHSYCLYEPGCINTESLGMRGIGSVSHFMECCRQSSSKPIGQPVDAPPGLPVGDTMTYPASQLLSELKLARMPRRKNGTVIDWCAYMRESWDFSEDGAYEALQLFLSDGVRRYEKESGRSDQLNTSRISPYMHFGQISPRQVLWEAKPCRSKKFLRKLAWRDLSYWLLTLWPDMDSQPIRPHYRGQRWSSDASHLRAWQRGNTGYPLVDASMRQLWAEGWMNNYMRHVVASFLISYLHLHWVEGYKWFQDTLLDADVAINAMMWQNGGMSGLDHWNFVMHPVDAAMTCDPKGDYVRRWVPELKGLPDEFVHKPWKCPPSILRRAKVQLGINYPQRILMDLDGAREQSLQDVVKLRLAHNGQYIDRYTGNDLVPLPNGLLIPVITRKEFKYRTAHPDAKDNPHTAVLRGYRSRKRDEIIAREQRVDFMASTMSECAERHTRYELYTSLE